MVFSLLLPIAEILEGGLGAGLDVRVAGAVFRPPVRGALSGAQPRALARPAPRRDRGRRPLPGLRLRPARPVPPGDRGHRADRSGGLAGQSPLRQAGLRGMPSDSRHRRDGGSRSVVRRRPARSGLADRALSGSPRRRPRIDHAPGPARRPGDERADGVHAQPEKERRPRARALTRQPQPKEVAMRGRYGLSAFLVLVAGAVWAADPQALRVPAPPEVPPPITRTA